MWFFEDTARITVIRASLYALKVIRWNVNNFETPVSVGFLANKLTDLSKLCFDPFDTL